jgi:bifunctional DNase/RNase
MPDLHAGPSADEDVPEPGSDLDQSATATEEPLPVVVVPEPAAPPGPEFRVMEVVNVTVELPNAHATLWLQETEMPFRQLTIPIGIPDANTLAQALRKIETPRPLTHELFTTVLRRYHIDLIALRVVARRSGTYFAELDLMSPAGKEVVACRPSDGVTLALRAAVRAPVLADRRLLDVEGDVEAIVL